MFSKPFIKSMANVIGARLFLVLVVGVMLVSSFSPVALAQSDTDSFNLRANDTVPGTGELADSMIYLPLVMKNFPLIPTTPVLSAISNTDGDGNYTISWSLSDGADTYALEEDDDAGFSSPSTVYAGSGASTTIINQAIGIYYYRVKGSNTYSSSDWSNAESVAVTVLPPDCPQTGTWSGVTSDGQPVTFDVENSPGCQIASESLALKFENNCDTTRRTVIIGNSIPITDDHFDFSNIDTEVIGDFPSSSMASGTFDIELSTNCYGSGTWSATVNGANDAVDALTLQADDKILVGGRFTSLGGQPREGIGRLNSDGSLDTLFNPETNGSVKALAVQSDGKILVGGTFTELGGQLRERIGRLNSDGTLDPTFNPGAGGTTYAMAVEALVVQSDGKIVVGGHFTTLGGQPREMIGRLNSNGTIDTTFNPGANGRIKTLVVQPDGKILVGGSFTELGGQPRDRIGRLNSDGTLDTTFNPGVSAPGSTWVGALVVQPDGKIVVGGYFTTLDGQPRDRIGRLNSDGTLDASFDPGASFAVDSLVVQDDGKIVVGGSFTELGGQSRDGIGRLNSDGSLDASPNLEMANDLPSAVYVFALAVQDNDKIILGGLFTEVGGEMRMHIARLNSDGTLDDPLP